MFKAGDELEAKDHQIDSAEQKISLSLKDLKQSPVQAFANKLV